MADWDERDSHPETRKPHGHILKTEALPFPTERYQGQDAAKAVSTVSTRCAPNLSRRTRKCSARSLRAAPTTSITSTAPGTVSATPAQSDATSATPPGVATTTTPTSPGRVLFRNR